MGFLFVPDENGAPTFCKSLQSVVPDPGTIYYGPLGIGSSYGVGTCVDSYNHVWCMSWAGFTVYDVVTKELLTTIPSTGIDTPTKIVADTLGYVWVIGSTLLYAIKASAPWTVTPYDIGRSGNSRVELFVDSLNHLWISGNGGNRSLYVFDTNEIGATARTLLYGTADCGVPPGQFTEANGVMWCASNWSFGYRLYKFSRSTYQVTGLYYDEIYYNPTPAIVYDPVNDVLVLGGNGTGYTSVGRFNATTGAKIGGWLDLGHTYSSIGFMAATAGLVWITTVGADGGTEHLDGYDPVTGTNPTSYYFPRTSGNKQSPDVVAVDSLHQVWVHFSQISGRNYIRAFNVLV